MFFVFYKQTFKNLNCVWAKMTRGNTNDPIWFDKRKAKNIYFMRKKKRERKQ